MSDGTILSPTVEALPMGLLKGKLKADITIEGYWRFRAPATSPAPYQSIDNLHDFLQNLLGSVNDHGSLREMETKSDHVYHDEFRWMRRGIPSWSILLSFVEVVQSGSVTKTAARLHLTQSAVSHHISQLEGFVEQRLFERSGKTMKPTANARALAFQLQSQLRGVSDALKPPARSPGIMICMWSLLPSFIAIGLPVGLTPSWHCIRKFRFGLAKTIDAMFFPMEAQTSRFAWLNLCKVKAGLRSPPTRNLQCVRRRFPNDFPRETLLPPLRF